MLLVTHTELFRLLVQGGDLDSWSRKLPLGFGTWLHAARDSCLSSVFNCRSRCGMKLWNIWVPRTRTLQEKPSSYIDQIMPTLTIKCMYFR